MSTLYCPAKSEHLQSNISSSDHTTTPPESTVSEDRVESIAAIGTGYSESKWVAEEILHQVADRANLSTMAVRLGQVCCDRLGHWNEKEWFPAVVKSAVFTRCLPGDMNEVRVLVDRLFASSTNLLNM